MTRPAVFLDRDGTLNQERGYLDRIDMLALFPWTADAVRLLNRAGFVTVVVTNQAAIGRGIIDEAFLDLTGSPRLAASRSASSNRSSAICWMLPRNASMPRPVKLGCTSLRSRV